MKNEVMSKFIFCRSVFLNIIGMTFVFGSDANKKKAVEVCAGSVDGGIGEIFITGRQSISELPSSDINNLSAQL
jgi:hypothetical protein